MADRLNVSGAVAVEPGRSPTDSSSVFSGNSIPIARSVSSIVLAPPGSGVPTAANTTRITAPAAACSASAAAAVPVVLLDPVESAVLAFGCMFLSCCYSCVHTCSVILIQIFELLAAIVPAPAVRADASGSLKHYSLAHLPADWHAAELHLDIDLSTTK